MIILSRRREVSDIQMAQTLADRFGTHVLSIPFLYDLRARDAAVRRLREMATRTEESCVFVAPLPKRATESLLESLLGQTAAEQFRAVIEYRSDSADDVIQVVAAGMNSEPTSQPGTVEFLEEATPRRWYPVIDGKRCTGCLECVNFCLFGVYVIGENDRPSVDQPDACRDGCPACSRVCPGQAIMFPMHDDEVIAGYSIAGDSAEHKNGKGDSKADASTEKANAEKNRYLDELVDEVEQWS